MKILILIVVLSLVYADTIHLERGGTYSDVQITKESYTIITYQTSEGESRSLPPSSVKKIDYSDAPSQFIDGKNAFVQGNYEEAIKMLSEAMEIAKEPPIVRDWIEQHGNFYLGRSYHEWAENTADQDRYKQAVSFYEKTVSKQNDSIFLYECHFYSAQCHLKIS